MTLPAAVIIPTVNRRVFVRELIASILSGTALPAEIVVVDQSDEADTELSSLGNDRCRVVLRRPTARGASAARNDGIRAAAHDMLVFVDDDVVAAPDWLEALVGALTREGSRTIVSGLVAAGAREGSGTFAPSLKSDAEPAVYAGRGAANVLWTGNMAMFRSVVQDVGFFDERLGPGKARFPGGGEDNDFCFRALEAGYRVVYEPRAVVTHRAWRPAGDYVRTQWRYGRGQGGFYGKHVQVRDRYILRQLTTHFVSCCGDAVRNVRSPRLAAGSAAYAAGILSAAAEWLVTERVRG